MKIKTKTRAETKAMGIRHPTNWKIKAPLRPTNLADQLYEQILQRIVSGALPIDSKLPSEYQMVEIFDVSRPVVREALARLQADGIVISKHGSGSYVHRRPGPAFAQLAPPGDIAGLMRCIELRIALEGEAAALAARRRTSSALGDIEKSLAELDLVISKSEVGVEADLKFHISIATASQNELFVQSLESLSKYTFQGMQLARSLSLRRSKERLNLVQREHLQIYEAIKDEDMELARQHMRTHIENARIRVLTDSMEP